VSQFLYLQFKVTPKGSLAHAIGNETVAIELLRSMSPLGGLNALI
jgi:hypothetical protein